MEKQHQIFFDFLRFSILIPGLLVILAIMYIMQVVFGMSASRLIVPPNEKYGRFVLNEVLEAGTSESMIKGIAWGSHSWGIISKGCIET